MDDHLILGVHITNRLQHAGAVQEILTEYGCNIKTRLGLHETGSQACSPNGILLLEVVGEEAKGMEMADKLNGIEGVEVQTMKFTH